MDITKYFKDPKLIHTFVNWFVLEAMADDKQATKVIEGAILKNKKYDLTMQLNGVELNPIASLEELEKQFNTLVKEEAAEKLADDYNYLRNSLDKMREMLEDSESQMRTKLGLPDEY